MNESEPYSKRRSGRGWPAFMGGLFGSGFIAAFVALIPAYIPAPRNFEWVKSGLAPADCAASDTVATFATPKPHAANCGSSDVDTIAVCRDGIEYKNLSNPKNDASFAWCSYKAIKAEYCKDGKNPGIVWVCREIQKKI